MSRRCKRQKVGRSGKGDEKEWDSNGPETISGVANDFEHSPLSTLNSYIYTSDCSVTADDDDGALVDKDDTFEATAPFTMWMVDAANSDRSNF